MVEIEKSEEINFSKDISLLTIKPEPLSDGRGDRIYDWVRAYCIREGLKIVIDVRKTLTKEDIIAHYSGPNKLIETGKKVMASVRVSDPSKSKMFVESGFASLSYEELGRRVFEIELGSYPGKEARLLVISGKDALSKMAHVRGASDPNISAKGTIRGEFSSGMGIIDILLNNKSLDNIVHVTMTFDELKEEMKRHLGITPEQVAKSVSGNLNGEFMVRASQYVRREGVVDG
ncbi:MAG: hypothetical protein QXR73_02335 [Candidatus Micrarchaeaceae archaeon]